MNSKVGQDGYGDLYILNVKESHAGNMLLQSLNTNIQSQSTVDANLDF